MTWHRQDYKLYLTYFSEIFQIEDTTQDLGGGSIVSGQEVWRGMGNIGYTEVFFKPSRIFPNQDFKKNPTLPVLYVEEIDVSFFPKIGEFSYVIVARWNDDSARGQWAVLGALFNLQRASSIKTTILVDRAFYREVEKLKQGKLDKKDIRDLKSEMKDRKPKYSGPQPWGDYSHLQSVEILNMRVSDGTINYDPLPEPLELMP